jgi:hypothetical protein
MGDYTECPRSGHKAGGGIAEGVYINLHQCNNCETIFCGFCGGSDDDGESCCPECESTDVDWDWDEAYAEQTDI